jgi:hypothetical protein
MQTAAAAPNLKARIARVARLTTPTEMRRGCSPKRPYRNLTIWSQLELAILGAQLAPARSY